MARALYLGRLYLGGVGAVPARRGCPSVDRKTVGTRLAEACRRRRDAYRSAAMRLWRDTPPKGGKDTEIMMRWTSQGFSNRGSTVTGPSLRRAAPVTFWLMTANVVVTLLTTLFVSQPDVFFWNWGLVPSQLGASLHGWVTVFTSMFLHGGWLHLAANMIMLYFAGRLVETRIGSQRTAILYGVAGVLAALAQVAWDPSSGIPMVGASGAISGVFAAAVMLAPRERVLLITPFTLFIPIPMRLLTLGWLWLALQIIGLMGADPFGGGVAYMAHLGGYAGGVFFVWGLSVALARRQKSGRESYARRLAIQHGPAPSPSFKTVYVTDSMGRTFAFHEPR